MHGPGPVLLFGPIRTSPGRLIQQIDMFDSVLRAPALFIPFGHHLYLYLYPCPRVFALVSCTFPFVHFGLLPSISGACSWRLTGVGLEGRSHQARPATASQLCQPSQSLRAPLQHPIPIRIPMYSVSYPQHRSLELVASLTIPKSGAVVFQLLRTPIFLVQLQRMKLYLDSQHASCFFFIHMYGVPSYMSLMR